MFDKSYAAPNTVYHRLYLVKHTVPIHLTPRTSIVCRYHSSNPSLSLVEGCTPHPPPLPANKHLFLHMRKWLILGSHSELTNQNLQLQLNFSPFLRLQILCMLKLSPTSPFDNWSWIATSLSMLDDTIKNQFLAWNIHTSQLTKLMIPSITIFCQVASLVQISTLHHIQILRFTSTLKLMEGKLSQGMTLSCQSTKTQISVNSMLLLWQIKSYKLGQKASSTLVFRWITKFSWNCRNWFDYIGKRKKTALIPV